MEKNNQEVGNRQAFWGELNSDEKIERMRQVVKGVQAFQEQIHEDLATLELEFISHDHMGGRLMKQVLKSVPVSHRNRGHTHKPKRLNDNEVYF